MTRSLVLVSALALVTACSSEQKKAAPTAADPPATATAPAEPALAPGNVVTLSVTENGFEPDRVRVKGGEPVKLVVTRKTDKTCATELVLPQHDINQKLPLGEPVEIAFTPEKSGELKYGCGMDQMISGVLLVE
jgi:plastocyanin domain-containing protein